MTLKLTALTAAAALALAACSQQAETSVAPESAAPAASAAAPSENVQTLSSKDGAISVQTAGAFADQSGNAEWLPAGFQAADITLLQRDEQSSITLYAAALGAPKQAAADYFANLKNDLEKAEGISDVKVGAATENRMDYAFKQGDDFQESCIAIHTTEQLYNVCANGSGVSADQLADVLKDVKLNKTAP